MVSTTYVLDYTMTTEKANYYDILELTSSASLVDIKKSYKRLALKYHPDKQKEGCDENNDQFARVSEAYQILSDPIKRQDYDLHGHTEQVTFAPPEEMFHHFFETMLESGFFGISNNSLMDLFDGPEADIALATLSTLPQTTIVFQQVHDLTQGTKVQPIVQPLLQKVQTRVDKACRRVNPRSTKNIEITLRVSLEDVFNRILKRIKIKRIRRQKDADGSERYLSEEKAFIVPLYDSYAVFSHEADELPEYDQAGDVMVHVLVKEHEIFKPFRSKHVLLEKRISLYELHDKCCFYVQHLNGEILKISTRSSIHNQVLQKVKGEGLPIDRLSDKRGDLYVRFILDESQMTSDKMAILKEHFPPVTGETHVSTAPSDMESTEVVLEPVATQPIYI